MNATAGGIAFTDAWLRAYDPQHAVVGRGGVGTTPWASIWPPGRCYMPQCDFAYLISPELFDRLVVPDLTGCAAAMDHAFYHLDGIGQLRDAGSAVEAEAPVRELTA